MPKITLRRIKRTTKQKRNVRAKARLRQARRRAD